MGETIQVDEKSNFYPESLKRNFLFDWSDGDFSGCSLQGWDEEPEKFLFYRISHGGGKKYSHFLRQF